MLNRRHFLTGSAAMVAAMGLPIRAQAASPSDRKFVFVFNPGGWDPTRVLADTFDNQPNVSMEPFADRLTLGGLTIVDHPNRPAVRQFFELHHERCLILNGLMVRSIAHEICTLIAMTGTSSGLAPDWPAALAAADAERYVLPHLVLGGPSFPGPLGVAVARAGTNGQLENLVSGHALDASVQPVRTPDAVSEALVDRYLARRSAAKLAGADSALEQQLLGDFDASMAKLERLKGLRYSMDFTGGTTLELQAQVAVDALAQGVSRCVTLAHTGESAQGWDTHANNDPTQSELWEGLFGGLAALVQLLQSTEGDGGGSLYDETTVVVLSEMGRTPLLNGTLGKDHWPYTSALLLGAGITGDRVVGGYDAQHYGLLVDPASGEVSGSGQVLSAEALGATLLQMADVDPDEFVSGVQPLTGVLA